MKKVPQTLKKYFASYFIVFCIPAIILTFFCYTYFIDRFKDMTIQIEMNEQNYRINEMDDKFEQIRTIASQLNPTFNIYMSDLNESMVSRMQLIQQLRAWMVADSGIDEIILWLSDDQLIYTSTGTFTNRTYAEINGVNLEQTFQLSDGRGQLADSIVANVFIDKSTPRHFYVAYPYPSSAANPIGQLVFKLNSSRFVPFHNRDYLLFFRGQLIVNNSSISEKEIGNLPNTDAAEVGGSTYVTSYASINDIKVVSILDNQIMFADFYHIRLLFIFILIGVFTISVSILSYFSYRNYKPIQALDKTLTSLGFHTGKQTIPQSEITRSIQLMESLASDNRRLDSEVLRESYNTRDLWLSRLIYHQYEDINLLMDTLANYDVVFSASHYCIGIILFSIESESGFDLKDHQYRVNDANLYFFQDTESRLVAIFCGDKNLKNRLPEQLKNILHGLESMQINAEAYLGDVYQNVADCNLSFVDALSMIDYQGIHSGKIHFYQNSQNANQRLLYPQEELNRLADAISEKDAEKIQLLSGSIVQQINHNCYDFSFAKTIGYEVFNCIMKSNQEQPDPDFTGFLRCYLTRLDHIHTRKQVCDLLTDLKQNLTDKIRVQSADSLQNLHENNVDKILAYITDNYMKEDFYLSDLAERFHVSLNNLSQQLKRRLGVTPNKYIIALRVEKAKRLLIHTDQTVKEISKAVGFSEVSSFIRNFKSVTASTPSQYRDLHRGMG